MKNCKGKSLFTRRLFYCLATLAVLIITNSAIAQKTVTGQIKDKDGNPLAAATVAVKNKKVNAVADAEGRFTISAAPGDILLVTSVGYTDVEVKLGDQAAIMIELSLKVSSMEDVVIVGYGTQKKKDLTGSIVNINTNETKKYSTSDISQLLQGRASGVQVNSDGQPGAVPSVRIRGYSTFGNAQPFYVVDGVPGVTVRDFSPNDIETINVLKDASAGSIYGADDAPRGRQRALRARPRCDRPAFRRRAHRVRRPSRRPW